MLILIDSVVVASKLAKNVKQAEDYENELREKAAYSGLKNVFQISLL